MIICLLFLFGGSKIVSAQCLSGNYTIGPIGANYTSFTAAINDLVANGICGPVEFLVAQETYNEQLTIPYIQGVSDVSRIVFKSNPANLNKPIIINSPAFTNPYLLLLDSANYITFDGLWLNYGDPGVSVPYESATILLRNSASHNTIKNCELYAGSQTGRPKVWSCEWYPAPTSINDNELSNCEILLGDVKFRGDGVSSGNNRITDNFFGEGGLLSMASVGSFEISNNTFQNVTPTSTGPAISIGGSDSEAVVNGNKLVGEWSTGISVSGGYAVSTILISNNMITCGTTNADIKGISIFSVTNAKIYNNNVGIYSTVNPGYDAALYMQSSTNIDLKNNIFANFAGNSVMYITQGLQGFRSNNNDLFTTGDTLITMNGVKFKDLAAWQANFRSRDTNSYSVNPLFTDTNDLHVNQLALRNKAVSFPEVKYDIDREPRNAKPDIGADEFSAVTDSVWPGDANDDGICDANDLIPIGMYFNEQGPGRVPFSNSWVAYAAQMWNVQIPNFNDAKFADCNGDGIVNLDDTLAFTINGGNSHPLRTKAFNSLSNKMAYVNFLSDTINNGSYLNASLEFDPFVGGLHDSIYSFNFSSLLSPTIVLSNSLYVDHYIPSWGNYATDYITRSSLNSNKFSISATAINHQNNISDQIHFHFGFNVINSTGVGFWYKIPVVDFKVYDRLGNILDYNLVSDSIYVTTITSIEENNIHASSLYVQNNNTITFISPVNKFRLYDVTGRLIIEKENLKIGNEIQIPSSNSNLYVIQMEKDSKIIRDKILVEGNH